MTTRIVKDENLFKASFASLSFKSVEQEDGHIKRHLVLEKRDAVCVTLVDKATGKLLFVSQFRTGAFCNTSSTNPFIIEPVAGHIDDGETPEQAAIREVKEETTLDASHLRLVAQGFTSPGITNEKHYHFLGEIDSREEGFSALFDKTHGIDDEQITLKMFSVEEAKAMIATGEICSANTLVGILAHIAQL